MQTSPVQVYRDNGLTSLPLENPYFMYNKGGYIDPDAERYGIGGILKSVAPIAAGFAMGPMGLGFGTMAQIGAGAITGFGLGGFNNIMDAITGGLAGWAGGGASAALEAAAPAGGALSGSQALASQAPGVASSYMPFTGASAIPQAGGQLVAGGPLASSGGGMGYINKAAMNTAGGANAPMMARAPATGFESGIHAAAANQPVNQSTLMTQAPTGGGSFPIRQPASPAQVGAPTTLGQNVPPSFTSAGQTPPPPSFSDYLKDKLTDPKTLGMGAASLLLGQEQPQYDASAGTFPEVNRALTDEERASYAMRGLTDPANTAFQPPNVAVGGMPQSLFGREGGAVPFQEGGATEDLNDILGEDFIRDYVETLPSDRPDTMPDRLDLSEREVDEELYANIIENEESIMDREAINNLLNDPDMAALLRSETDRTLNGPSIPSTRDIEWGNLDRELMESRVPLPDTGVERGFQVGGGVAPLEDDEESAGEAMTSQIVEQNYQPVPSVPTAPTETTAPSTMAGDRPITTNVMAPVGPMQMSPADKMIKTSSISSTPFQTSVPPTGLEALQEADSDPQVMENLVEGLAPKTFSIAKAGPAAYGPLNWDILVKETDASPLMVKTLQLLMPDLPSRLNKETAEKEGFSGWGPKAMEHLARSQTTPSPPVKRTFGGGAGSGPFSSSHGGPIPFQTGGDVMENLVAGLRPKVRPEEEESQLTTDPNYDALSDAAFKEKYYEPKKDYWGNPIPGQYEMMPAMYGQSARPLGIMGTGWNATRAPIPNAAQARKEFPGGETFTPPSAEEPVRGMGHLLRHLNLPAGEIAVPPTSTPPEAVPMENIMAHINSPTVSRQVFQAPNVSFKGMPKSLFASDGGSIPFQAGGATAPPQMNPQAMQHLQQEAAKGVPWAVELMGRINQRGQPAQQALGPQVQRGMAEGGPVLESGSFVIPADVVSSFGDGSSDEGHRKLSEAFSSKFARGGNVISGEIKGPGGGLDDLVQSSIEGVRSARVSNDEFVIPSSVVNQIGDGNTKAGSEKLYNFIKNVRLNKHGSTQQPSSINNVGIKSLLS